MRLGKLRQYFGSIAYEVVERECDWSDFLFGDVDLAEEEAFEVAELGRGADVRVGFNHSVNTKIIY